MRDLFPGYYRPTDEEFQQLWNEGMFVLDANVLLNVYRYTPEVAEALLAVLEKLQEQLWIPHQVALEYHKNRLDVISTQSKVLDDIKKAFDAAFERLNADIKKALPSRSRHPFIDVGRVDGMVDGVRARFEEIKGEIAEMQNQYPDFLDDDALVDPYKERLTSLLASRVSPPMDERTLQDVYKEARQRYDQEVPPGYKDDKEKSEPEKYSDVVIWYQVIDRAKEQRKPVILVTDDKKEDWWLQHRGMTIGPRPELIQEMRDKADMQFYMYQTSQFIQRAQEVFDLLVKKDVIEEAVDVREQMEAQQLAYSAPTGYMRLLVDLREDPPKVVDPGIDLLTQVSLDQMQYMGMDAVSLLNVLAQRGWKVSGEYSAPGGLSSFHLIQQPHSPLVHRYAILSSDLPSQMITGFGVDLPSRIGTTALAETLQELRHEGWRDIHTDVVSASRIVLVLERPEPRKP